MIHYKNKLNTTKGNNAEIKKQKRYDIKNKLQNGRSPWSVIYVNINRWTCQLKGKYWHNEQKTIQLYSV